MIRDLTKRQKIRSEPYLDYVRSLPCVGCGVQGRVHAHHCIADRHGSSKHADISVMPLCPSCHAALHAGWHDWEDAYGSQWRHVYETIARAAADGVLVVNNKAAREMAA